MEHGASSIRPIVRLKAASLGEEGRAWLAGLSDLVAELEALWAVRIDRSLSGGTSAFVAAAHTSDGTPLVLKISLPDPDAGDEIGTLERARGRGYVRLVANDRARRAMLLEALGPALDQVDMPPEEQIETLSRMLTTAWTVPPPASGPSAVPHDKATALDGLVRRLWRELDQPCSQLVVDQALQFTRRRAAAFDPTHSVQVHGDAAAANALRVLSPRPGAETGFVFVDPDGFVGDRAYDLGVALRDWCAELLASGDPRALARRYCERLARHTGVDAQAIWEWGYVERVSTGMDVLAMGARGLSRPFFQTAEALL